MPEENKEHIMEFKPPITEDEIISFINFLKDSEYEVKHWGERSTYEGINDSNYICFKKIF